MDQYRNFLELMRHEKEGRDYEVHQRKGASGIAVIAPHGGGIEPGTMDIADSVAGEEHTFYCFKGIKATGNQRLHIASDRFDEPRGLDSVQEARHVLSIHGCTGNEEVIVVGGRDQALKDILINIISRAGFRARESDRSGLKGTRPGNICNRGRTGKGGQVEISEGLRRKLFDRPEHGKIRNKRAAFHQVVAALRKALAEYEKLF